MIIPSSQTRKVMLREITELGSGQCGIHFWGFLNLEPMPFTGKTIDTLLPTPLQTMPSLHQNWNSNFDTMENKVGDGSYTIGCRSGESILKCAILWLPSLKVLGSFFPIGQRRFKVHLMNAFCSLGTQGGAFSTGMGIRSLQRVFLLFAGKEFSLSLCCSKFFAEPFKSKLQMIRRLWL